MANPSDVGFRLGLLERLVVWLPRDLHVAAGFQEINTTVITHHYDHRNPKKRAAFLEYFYFLLSGAPALIQAGKVTQEEVDEMAAEFSRLKDDPDSVIF